MTPAGPWPCSSARSVTGRDVTGAPNRELARRDGDPVVEGARPPQTSDAADVDEPERHRRSASTSKSVCSPRLTLSRALAIASVALPRLAMSTSSKIAA
jgi:hypothetical protein